MGIDDIDDVDTGREDVSNETNVRLNRNAVNELKQEAGVTRNSEVSPLVEAAVWEYLGDDDKADDAQDEFAEQFEDEGQ